MTNVAIMSHQNLQTESPSQFIWRETESGLKLRQRSVCLVKSTLGEPQILIKREEEPEEVDMHLT